MKITKLGRPLKKREDKRYKTFHVKMTEEEFEILSLVALKRKMSKSDFVRMAIHNEIRFVENSCDVAEKKKGLNDYDS